MNRRDELIERGEADATIERLKAENRRLRQRLDSIERRSNTRLFGGDETRFTAA